MLDRQIPYKLVFTKAYIYIIITNLKINLIKIIIKTKLNESEIFHEIRIIVHKPTSIESTSSKSQTPSSTLTII